MCHRAQVVRRQHVPRGSVGRDGAALGALGAQDTIAQGWGLLCSSNAFKLKKKKKGDGRELGKEKEKK